MWIYEEAGRINVRPAFLFLIFDRWEGSGSGGGLGKATDVWLYGGVRSPSEGEGRNAGG